MTRVGGLDLFPPGAAISPVDYTDSLTEVGIDFELLDVAEWPPLAAAAAAGRHAGAAPADAAIVPAGLGTRTMQDGDLRTAPTCARTPRSPAYATSASAA